MTDSELRSKLLAKSTMIQTLGTEVVDVPSQTGATNVILNDRDDVELAETAKEVCEEEFRAKYMPEDRGSDMAINFISKQAKSRDESHTIEDVRRIFDTVESMIKGVLQQYLNVKDGKVRQAKSCAHEIHLKPGIVPVKH